MTDEFTPEEFLTVRDLMARLRRHPSTLGNWRASGTGPPWVKVDRKVYYPRSEFESWLAAHPEHDAERPEHAEHDPPGRGPYFRAVALPPRIGFDPILDALNIDRDGFAELVAMHEAPRPMRFRGTELGFEQLVIRDWFARLRGERPDWRPDRWPPLAPAST